MYIIFYILNQYANIIIIQRILFRVQPTTFDYKEIYNLAFYTYERSYQKMPYKPKCTENEGSQP